MPDPRLGFDSYTSEGDFYRDDSLEQQRIDEQRDFAFGGGLLKGITELPLDIMEFLSPEDEYSPGALAPDQSSPRQRIRTERLHGEQFYDELKSDPITKQAAEVGYGASMVVDPVLDTGLLMAPHLLKGLNAIRKGEKPAIKLADLMTDEVGAVGDIAYHGTSSDVQKFDPAKFGESTQAKSAKQGVWLVSDPNTAHGYADYSARNAPVEAKIREANAHEKRGDWDAYDESLREVEELEAKLAGKTDRLGQNIMPLKYEGDYHIEDMEGAEFMDNQRHIDAVIEGARDKGKDGVIFQNLSDDAGVSNRPAEHTVVFDPKNIKSAFEPAKIGKPTASGAGVSDPSKLKGKTREEFLGSPKITTDENAADLVPKELNSVAKGEETPFMGGYTIKKTPEGAAVYDHGEVIASYNRGDTLVVDPAYRGEGIGTELVYDYRTTYPDAKVAKERTKSAQAIQEKVWERIEGDLKKIEDDVDVADMTDIQQSALDGFRLEYDEAQKLLRENPNNREAFRARNRAQRNIDAELTLQRKEAERAKPVVEDEGYQGQHQPAMREEGVKASGDDLSDIYPEDVYGMNGAQYYGHGGENVAMDNSSISKMRDMRGNPKKEVYIFRAIPKDVGASAINKGDWVTINRDYAKQHGESTLRGEYKILRKKVKANEIFTSGDSIHEWGYDPR